MHWWYRARDGRSGFSLVELLLVIAVVGILIGIAFPSIDVLRSQTESAMLGLGSTLQAAQREAVARQHDVMVRFDVPAGRLTIHYDGNNNGAVDAGERVRGVALERQIVFGRSSAPARPFGAAAVGFGPNGVPTLVFHRNGSASGAGGLYLTSAKAAAGDPNRVRDTRAVEVVRATGRIGWWRYTGGQWHRGF